MELYLNTVSETLWLVLQKLMTIEALDSFRIVGGTSLSLQLGHRESVDIDLFTDSDYGSIDFDKIDASLTKTFPYVDTNDIGEVGMGKSYFIGYEANDLVKLDLFYTDTFVFPCKNEQGIRFSAIEEVAAMKLELISNGGRKKDFWDIHELLERYTLSEMYDFYKKRTPYGYSKEESFAQLLNFSFADNDFTPNCLRGKDWELIKLDFEDLVKE